MSTNAPRYRSIADQIRREYVDGTALPGDRLPTEADFSRRFGVSRGTVVKAIELLVSDKAVVRRQGAGTFVSEPLLRLRQGGLVSFTQSMQALGHIASHQVLSIDQLPEARSRALGSAEPLTLFRRLRFVDGTPISLHESAIPSALFTALQAAHPMALALGARAEFSLHAALEASGHPVWRAQEKNRARLAESREAALLGRDLPLALMDVQRVSFDRGGRMLDATTAIYLSDSYQVEIDLSRDAVTT
ncbi:GntR family transcriptional regulator [Pseudorhodobacter sp.]|uniref:GntR family transcriptional regulator n=1 Tax=Pseudorhodobacter sp. TaxID=1934400 RepID=UPI002647BA50|nr:GntR family transcriptional regulator [Pseudorhodobacter sp.]MDN5786573.1 GntR family transcriptional regulator [Pseudorhodobacter sp.]